MFSYLINTVDAMNVCTYMDPVDMDRTMLLEVTDGKKIIYL